MLVNADAFNVLYGEIRTHMCAIDTEAVSHTFGAVFPSKSKLAVTNIVTQSLITSSSILTDIVGH